MDPDDSRRLAATGSPELVRLLVVDDDHPRSELSSSGRLVELVRELLSVHRADASRV